MTALDEEEPSATTVAPLTLLGDKQKRAEFVRTCPRMPFPDMRNVTGPQDAAGPRSSPERIRATRRGLRANSAPQ